MKERIEKGWEGVKGGKKGGRDTVVEDISVFMDFPSVQTPTVCFLFLLLLFLLFCSFSSVFLFVCLFWLVSMC